MPERHEIPVSFEGRRFGNDTKGHHEEMHELMRGPGWPSGLFKWQPTSLSSPDGKIIGPEKEDEEYHMLSQHLMIDHILCGFGFKRIGGFTKGHSYHYDGQGQSERVNLEELSSDESS